MNAMKKILALALAGVMALALLTGCGTGSSASHKSSAKAMEDYDRGVENNLNITCTSSAELDAKLQQLANCCQGGLQQRRRHSLENSLQPLQFPHLLW